MQKDPEAATLIRDACARQPDAAYLLVQRAIALDYALQAANAQIAKLQAELDQSRPAAQSAFLDTSNTWGRSAAAPAQSPLAARAAGPAATPPAPASAAPASSWGSGMLGTVASTAAGVVAGSFLFQGIQGLMGHHGDGAHANPDAPLAPSGSTLLDSDDVADALDDSTDSVALDGGDFDSGDST